MSSSKIMKLIPKSKEKLIAYIFFFCLIGYLACPLSVQLDPVDWYSSYNMIWYADDFSTSRFQQDSDVAEDVYKCQNGLCANGPGQLYGKLVYTFATDWIIQVGRLGVVAESPSQTCSIDVYLDNMLAGSYNGSKEMLFCTSDNLPSSDDPRSWVVIQDPHSVQVKFIFYSKDSSGVKDLCLEQIEFSAKVTNPPPQGDDDVTLTGKVCDIETSVPLPDAQITLDSKSTKTDTQGRYKFENLGTGKEYKVKIIKQGYNTQESTISLSPCEPGYICNQHNFWLTPEKSSTPVSTTFLEGYVYDVSDNSTVGNAHVLLLYYHGLGTLYEAWTDTQGHYKIDNVTEKWYSLKILKDDYEPHDSDIEIIQGQNRHDAYLVNNGMPVYIPLPDPPGAEYYPPTPSRNPPYQPYVYPSAPAEYPTEGPKYMSPTNPAPSDGADYVPPPPGYTQSGNLPGSGLTPPPSPGIKGLPETVLRGWGRIFNYFKKMGGYFS